MKVRLNKWQIEVANDPHRFKVICAGRRSGKSFYARMQVLQWALKNPGMYWIVSPTFDQGKKIHWYQGFKPDLMSLGWIKLCQFNESELSVVLPNGARIQIVSAEHPDRLVGVKLRGLVVDEVATLKNWSYIWEKSLRPTLTDYQAPAIFISTPQGFNHFYHLYMDGQDASPENNYKSWRFVSTENTMLKTIDQEVISAKKELTEDTFQQEYMADFRKYTGLVYKEFQREVHVIEPFDIPDSWSIYRGMDFGSTNPTACLWIAVDGDENWFVIHEHYHTGETIDYHAGQINASPYSHSVLQTFGDPSGAQWIAEFATRGIHITPANKEVGTAFNTWVRYGIEKVSEKLKRVPGHTVNSIATKTEGGQPSLFIFSGCTNLIREFETYRWKEKSVTQAQDLNEPDVPEKANDHAMDALRYFAVSYRQQVVDDLPDETEEIGEGYLTNI